MSKKQIAMGLVLAVLLAACGSAATEGSSSAAQVATVASAEEEPTAPSHEAVEAAEGQSASSDFTLTSPVMEDGGDLPVTYTCDGDSLSPPLEWQGAPEGTVGYALAMHHVPGPGDTHWYWVVYDIPADVQSVVAGQTDFGTFGTNSVNGEQAYTPPCSQGPGEKLYTITVYALSASPDLPDASQVDRDTLLAAIADITLAEASIDVTYTR